MLDKRVRQIALEKESVELGRQRYERLMEKNPESELPPGVKLMRRAVVPMMRAIDEFKVPKVGGGKLQVARKFFLQFDTGVLAYSTLRRVLNSLNQVQPLQNLAMQIVSDLIDHLEYEKYKEEAPYHLRAVEKNQTTRNTMHRKRVIMRAKRNLGIEDSYFSQEDRLHLGSKLIDLAVSATGLVEITHLKARGKVSAVYLKASQLTLDFLEKQHAKCALLDPIYLPMVVPPADWTTPFDGGYLTNCTTNKVPLVKTRHKETLLALADHDMPKVYAAINNLQKVAYKVNAEVYEVMQTLWKTGGGLAKLPLTDDKPLPEKPWESDAEYEKLKETQPGIVKDWKRAANEVYDERVRQTSKRISMSQKLWVAEKYLTEEELYFVWTLDYRGRAYPLQNFVNPQGDDSGKALLHYAEGKELGETGSYWLAVHGANTYGNDKVSFDERTKWVLEHEQNIMLSAENPLDYRWWMEADKPFCFLAFCFEWSKSIKEGESFKSHLPIAMDGSCNGLQHFSALLKDPVGGAAVNLVPQDKPADIYSEVAKVVNQQVLLDAEGGNELAKLWLGKINRKICKPGVMTTPYGAKQFGLATQLQDLLAKYAGEHGENYLDTEDSNPATMYLAKVLWASIGNVVVAARQAMDWLQGVAKVASQSHNALVWHTPVGFQVVQRLKAETAKRIDTFWGGTRYQLSLASETEEIDGRRMVSSISPNFVHALDASHMMSTWNTMHDKGIRTFSPVHDSFATHACHVGEMNKTIRDEFLKQYSGNLLTTFREEVMAQLPEKLAQIITPHPSGDTLDLEQVKGSLYFFA